MKKNEIFARRRQRVLEQLERYDLLILPAAPERPRSRDVNHPYRQDSDLYYLTGFPEPEAVLLLRRDSPSFVLFCRPEDPNRAIWEGPVAGLEGGKAHYGAEESFSIEQLKEKLPEFLSGIERIFYPIGRYRDFDRLLLESYLKVQQRSRTGVRLPTAFVDSGEILSEMRLRKMPEELELMQRAVAISAEAHVQAMATCRPGLYEYQIEAELLYHFHQRGARFPAYPPIVASGKNSCILHYTANCDELKAGELLLIDAGAEYDHYAADITRTFPISGYFSPEQRAIYELVLEAQLAAIETIKPGVPFNVPHETAVELLTRGLIRLGLLDGDPKKLIEEGKYKSFYMHRTGHWLGMDVHDVGRYKVGDEWRQLEPGMVLTVEPGLYIAPNSQEADPKWWGIGIRIEDDVLVTERGHEVLSAEVPKRVEALEAVVGSNLSGTTDLRGKAEEKWHG